MIIVSSGAAIMTELSPLGRQLESLMQSGLVVPSPLPLDTAFPTARVVVPVYNSNGTSNVRGHFVGASDAKLAQRS